MASNILADRDRNLQPKTNSSAEKEKPKTMEYHRQVLESRLKSGHAEQTYISPSDEIMSPATQKLNAFRNKHVMKKSKPQTLFAKASSKNLEAAKGVSMFADIPKDKIIAEEKPDMA
ncbi:hypothetical protein K432DRAFT_386391 [Lepidopterella palustris CBS 459.81]|uniref:Spo12-like protein n=1 Tax=Lepidopterella palustris CBS 459.81 TaxID=1314670 RepID=A0A8E2E0K8_9PEZI|nr:hypothetical protein K432DRAFT_386391 [Lepidopterella palustris CBS 459.81]